MSREEQFEQSLDELASFLSADGFVTARAIAEKFSCSKVTVYKHIRALMARGNSFAISYVREGSTGPLSTAYKIIEK